MSAVYLGEILVNCWLAFTYTDGTTKMRKQRNEKNEKTKVVLRSTKNGRKKRKAGKVQQVLDGGGVQLGTSERPGRCQPSPLSMFMSNRFDEQKAFY